ncbi:MAG: hypothetical protein WDN04_25620 [Rhodospirillales bacterium]
MSMPRPLLAVALALSIAAPAWADTATIPGGQLVASLNLDSAASIEPDPTLHGQVRLTADDLSCVQTTGGGTATVTATGCGDQLGHLRIDVPAGSAITLTQDGDGSVHVGSTIGPLIANVGGSGDLTVGRVRRAGAERQGQRRHHRRGGERGSLADVQLQRIDPCAGRGRRAAHPPEAAPATSRSAASTPAPRTSSSRGRAMRVIGKGTIADLHARLSGSGDLVVSATAINRRPAGVGWWRHQSGARQRPAAQISQRRQLDQRA